MNRKPTEVNRIKNYSLALGFFDTCLVNIVLSDHIAVTI